MFTITSSEIHNIIFQYFTFQLIVLSYNQFFISVLSSLIQILEEFLQRRKKEVWKQNSIKELLFSYSHKTIILPPNLYKFPLLNFGDKFPL